MSTFHAVINLNFMRTFKIILGIIVILGLLTGGLPTLFNDISNGAAGGTILGELIGLVLMLALIYYLFSTANKANENN